ncbi:MAG: sulfatase-like hydrolase/transferase [Pseudomonadota bacterium]
MPDKKIRNILFIMYDQLRQDYLSCYGHQSLHTPNMDWLAENGVRFTQAYCQSPVCGSSRMSFYTGRYPSSHGAHWNGFPLKVGELTLGDHLRPLGMDSWLIGKTHMYADVEGMARLGLSRDTVIGARVAECGFDIWERDDGLWTRGPDGYYDETPSTYNEALKARGYESDNPWLENANAGIDDDGSFVSGMLMKYSGRAANIREADSETPYMTTRAIEFLDHMNQSGASPWHCHLSYIKPHWPYIVPAPYNNMYGVADIQAAVRDEREWENPHPVYEAFINNVICRAFQRDEVREAAIPAYMGLIKQCDDQLGRLLAHMKSIGRLDDTLIVLTSDHGDYLGDHWMGEKDLFHDPSVKIPMLIYDPSPAADATRGTVCDALVEAIDLGATFIEAAGGTVPDHIIEGRSLFPWLHGNHPTDWREHVVSEYDFCITPMCERLGLAPRDARLFMIADKRWKFVHSEGGYRPMLFDRETDPNELNDLGDSASHREVMDDMYRRLWRWGLRMSQRTTRSDQRIMASRGRSRRRGITLGVFDEADIDADMISAYRGAPKQLFVPGSGDD